MAASTNSYSLYLTVPHPTGETYSYCLKILGKDLIGVVLVRCPSLDQSSLFMVIESHSTERALPLASGLCQSEGLARPGAASLVSLGSFIHCITGVTHGFGFQTIHLLASSLPREK